MKHNTNFQKNVNWCEHLLSRSNRCANFQFSRSKIKVTGCQQPPESDAYLYLRTRGLIEFNAIAYDTRGHIFETS